MTPVGERIVEQAQRVLEESSRIREIAQSGRNQLTGTLTLGVIYTVAPYLLPDLIPALHDRAPQMPLDIEENLTENLESGLKSGRLDAAIVALPFAPPGVVTEFLYEEPFQVVVPVDAQVGEAQVGAAVRARGREHDPAQRRPLLPRPGARVVPGAEPCRRARAAHQLARDRYATWWRRGSASRCCRATR